MNAGDYHHRIRMVERTYAANENGDPAVDAEVEVYKGWAAIETLRSREYWAAMQVNSETTKKFKLPWSKKLMEVNSEKALLLWRGNEFVMLPFENVDEANELVVIRAVKK